MFSHIIVIFWLPLVTVIAGSNIGQKTSEHTLPQFHNVIVDRRQAALTVYPDIINGPGGYVTVTWTNYSSAAKSDWIGMFCPATATPNTTGPVVFRFLGSSTQINLPNSTGNLSFYVINLRQPCRFYLLR